MQDGTMTDYEIRKAAEKDVPKIIDLLKPWSEGDQLSRDVNNSWQNMIVDENVNEIIWTKAGRSSAKRKMKTQVP